MTETRGQKSGVSGPSSIFYLLSSRAIAFPICFFLVAVPWPSGLENLLTQSLMSLNVKTTVELLGLFSIPAIQHGNVIEVGTGMVGIDEACSGIRSLQATLMLGLFFGELYRLTVRSRLGLVLLGFGVAFVFNVGRTFLLTSIASARGIGAVAAWHDPAGIAILVACFLSLWLVARALSKAQRREQRAESREGNAETLKAEKLKSLEQKALVSGPAPVSISAFQLFSVCLGAWLLLVEGGIELWYRYHEHTAAAAKPWSLATENLGQVFTRVRIPSAIAGQFRADEGLNGRWQDAAGNSWQLYYFRWLPVHSLPQRVTVQLAKTHGPETCLPAVGMKLKTRPETIAVPVEGMELAAQQYEFTAEGRPLHVFYGIYEDPSGSARLANRRKDFASRVAAALAGSRNHGQRYLELAVFGPERPEDARAAFAAEAQKLIKFEN